MRSPRRCRRPRSRRRSAPHVPGSRPTDARSVTRRPRRRPRCARKPPPSRLRPADGRAASLDTKGCVRRSAGSQRQSSMRRRSATLTGRPSAPARCAGIESDVTTRSTACIIAARSESASALRSDGVRRRLDTVAKGRARDLLGSRLLLQRDQPHPRYRGERREFGQRDRAAEVEAEFRIALPGNADLEAIWPDTLAPEPKRAPDSPRCTGHAPGRLRREADNRRQAQKRRPAERRQPHKLIRSL